MKLISLLFIFLSITIATEAAKPAKFNTQKDLLLVQLDCKTDVDDLHTAAALITLMSHSSFSDVSYHAVAGTYGIQEGLYVPPNDLMQLAFEDNWTDAHNNLKPAVEKVKVIVKRHINKGGKIWIAEAGQSDFTADLIKAILKETPELDIAKYFNVVQHSDWNEKVTDPDKLSFVKEVSSYHKIPDGNAVGNGTPGFRTPTYGEWKTKLKNKKLLEIWQLAYDLGLQYNGVDGRYNNKAIAEHGLDFSDLSEVCWIMGIEDIKDTKAFFELYAY